MWVFMNDAFFSAVSHVSEPDVFVVRGRIKGDLERAFEVPEDEVIELPDSDYKFRIFVTRTQLKSALLDYIDGHLDYVNFKGSIPKRDGLRYRVYTEVWTVLWNLQNRLYGHQGGWWVNYRDR